MTMETQSLPQPSVAKVSPSRSLAGLGELERVRGDVRLRARFADGCTRLDQNYQAGAAKVKFPRQRAGNALEAVLVNTAGGLTGGDCLTAWVAAGAGATMIVATQAAERIYRSAAGAVRVSTNLAVAPEASLDWLPQETILFDGSALRRTLSADVAGSGRLLAVEAIVLGRAAMGERAKRVFLSDAWRIRRDGKMLFADGLRLDGDATEIMAGGATGNGATALATLLLVSPDAATRIDSTRDALLDHAGEACASAWNGMLVARLLSASGAALRASLVRLIETLRGEPVPRVWNC